MILDSGTMKICKLQNSASNGDMPDMRLVPFQKHWFQERTIGMNRLYLAMGQNERIDMIAYVHEDRKIHPNMYAVLGNGEQMIIHHVEHVIEENTNLRYTRLTCERLEDFYDIAEQAG